MTRAMNFLSVLLALLLVGGCARKEHAEEHTEAHSESGEHHDEGPRGPHGGRVLTGEGIALELVLSGEEEPPAYKAFLHDAKGGDVRPTTERLTAVLERMGRRRDTVAFRIDGDHFHSTEPIEEPHSFRVALDLERAGRHHTWSFEQEESRIELAPEAVRTAGIAVGTAGPSLIEVTVEVPGEVRLNAERVVQVRPRFPGIVRAMRKRLGAPVRRGETLVLVHSNESLAEYPIAAAMNGTVVSQDAAVGQSVDHETILYTVADLSTVWVDFPIYPQSAGRIRPGQSVHVQAESGPPLSGTGSIRYVGPLLEQDTRVSYGRVVLDNRSRRWQPGLYVTARIVVERVDVPVAVPEESIVRLSEGPAVFRAEGNRFEPQPVVTGRSDGRMTEIRQGLEAGAQIVVSKAFLLKAELGKGEAGHEH